MSTLTLNNAVRVTRSPYADAARPLPMARAARVAPERSARSEAPRKELHYEPLIWPLCQNCWNNASCADVLAGLFAANLMILVLFAAVVAFIAAGDVSCGRVCSYLLTWGSEVVLLAAGSLWVVLNLVQHAAEAGRWMLQKAFPPRPRFDLRYS